MQFWNSFSFILFALLLSPKIFASAETGYLPDLKKPAACSEKVQTQLKSAFAETKPQWTQVVAPDFETQAFRATPKVGEWYELRVSESKGFELWFFSSEKTSSYHWSPKSCEVANQDQAAMKFKSFENEAGVSPFTDAELKKLLAEHKSGIIYMWSPRMVYSVTESTSFAKVALKKKLAFTAVLDSVVPAEEAVAALKTRHMTMEQSRQIASATDLKRLASVDLYMRDAILHFPTVFVYKNGQINPHRLIGVLTPEGLSRALDQWLEEIP